MIRKIRKIFILPLTAVLCAVFTFSFAGESVRQGCPAQTFEPATAIKNYYVDPYTGTTNFTIPIYLPPARRNLPLKLNLVYSSRAGNGWLGVGWKLDLGVIERSTKNGYPKYDSTDTFVFFLGQEQNDLVFIGGQEYRPKTAQAAWKFIFDGQKWIVKDNTGNTYYFGLEDELMDHSRTKDPDSPNKIFRWRLSKISNTLGNSVIYKYLDDKIVIYYTEKSKSVKNSNRVEDYNYIVSIIFSDARTDSFSSLRSGFNDVYPYAGKGLIKEIRVEYQTNLIRRYDLQYKPSALTYRLLLDTITEYGKDNSVKNPPIRFNYEDRKNKYNMIRKESTPAGNNLWNIRVANINKPPKDDFWITPFGFASRYEYIAPIKWGKQHMEREGEDSGLHWTTEPNGNLKISGKKGQVFYAWTYITGKDDNGQITFAPAHNCNAKVFSYDYRYAIRWNVPDELPVSLFAGSTAYRRVDITGYNFNSDFSFELNMDMANQVRVMDSRETILPQLSGDFNGDGITDLGFFHKETGECKIMLSVREGFASAGTWIENFGKDEQIMIGDFNADGKTDLCTFNANRGSWRIALSDGTKFIDQGVWLDNFGKNSMAYLGEFNGDSYVDVVIAYPLKITHNGGTSYIYGCKAALNDNKKFLIQREFTINQSQEKPFVLGDFNADGITDFMSLSSSEGMKISDYNGKFKQEAYYSDLFPEDFSKLNRTIFIDYDGDGRSDNAYLSNSGGLIEGFNNLSDRETKDPTPDEQCGYNLYIPLTEPGGSRQASGSTIQAGDFDGNGRNDFAVYDASGNTSLIFCDDNFPDLLTSVENGWGGVLEFEYLPSTYYENRQNDTDWGMPFAMPVISRVILKDGKGNSYKNEFIYSKGYYDKEDKEFRGFGYVESSDNDGNLTQTYFLQDDIYKGKVLRQISSNNERKPFYENGNEWGSFSPYAGTYIVILNKTTEHYYQSDSNFKEKVVLFEHDIYGNQKLMKELGDTASNGDERETISEYEYNTADWLIGYPSHVYIKDAANKKISEKFLYYDGANSITAPSKGLLTKEQTIIFNPSTALTKTASNLYEYDSFGNIIRETDSLNRVTVIEFEQELHSYPSKIINSLGQTVQHKYDVTLGKLTEVIDANGQKTENIYDGLGRVIKVIGPNDSLQDPGAAYDYNVYSKVNIIENGSFERWEKDPDVYEYRYDFIRPIGWKKEKTSARLNRKDFDTVAGSYVVDLTWDGYFPNTTLYYDCPDYAQYAGKEIIFTSMVKSFITRDNIYFGSTKIAVDEGENITYSSLHSGNDGWELLKVIHKTADDPKYLRFIIFPNASANWAGEYTYVDKAEAFENGETNIVQYAKTSSVASPFVTKSLYDGLGRLIQTKSPAEPDSNKPRQIISDAVMYDHRNNVIEKFHPFFAEESENYTEVSDKPKFIYTYDCLGRLTKTENPDGTLLHTLYSGWDAVSIDENGNKIKTYNDAYGRVIKVEEYNGPQVYNTFYKYDALDNLTEIRDNQGNKTYFTYDNLGRKLTVNDPDMGLWQYEYDLVSNLTKQIGAKGQVIEFAYDSLNRVKTKKVNSQETARYLYDDTAKQFCIGRLSKIVDASGSIDYFYDNEGRQIKAIKSINGADFVFENAYDAMDRVTSIKYPGAEVVKYTYNSQGQLDKVSGNSEYVKNIDYSPSGQIIKTEYGNGVVTDYNYNLNNLRLTHILTGLSGKNLQDLNYEFDKAGNVTNIQDNTHTSSAQFSYDGLNRLVSARGAYGNFSYDYDSIGNILQKEGVNYSYNRALPHALRSSSEGYTFEYDQNGNLIKRIKANKAQFFSYNSENQLIKIEEGPTGDFLQTNRELKIHFKPGLNYFSLPYNRSNEIKTVMSSISGSRQEIAYWHPAQKKYLFNTGDAEFDDFRNLEYGKGYWMYITNPNGADFTLQGTLPITGQVALKQGWNAIACPVDVEMDVQKALEPLVLGEDYTVVARFVSSEAPYYHLYTRNKQEFTTLKPGEGYWIKMIRDKAWTINNTSRRRLRDAAAKTTLGEFVYDTQGQRVKKTAGGKTTLYAESLYEQDSDGAIRKHIFAGSNRICTVTASSAAARASLVGGEILYYHPDHLGSSNVITDSSGAQAQLDEYKPFGDFSTSHNPSSIIHHYFTGQELDVSTGLYDYGARYYHPALGRFIQPDPLLQDVYDPQSLNHYAYCRNNPLRLIDPTGMRWDDSYSSSYSYSGGYSSSTIGSNSSYHSWGSAYSWNSISGGMSSGWDVSGWSSLSGGGSWGYGSGIGGSLNSFTTNSMLGYSSGFGNLGYKSVGEVMKDAYYQPASAAWNDFSNTMRPAMNWMSENIAGPIKNTLTQPGYNLGTWLFQEKSFRTSFGAALDVGYLASAGYGMFNSLRGALGIGGAYWRYMSAESLPSYSSSGRLLNKTWLARGSSLPYDSFAIAKDKLQLPYMPTLVERVRVPFYRYVAGPRPAFKIENLKFGSGGGIEYRVGGWYGD